MRILQLHSNFIEYEPVEKEIPSAEPCEKKRNRLEELVVLFVAVEEGDDEAVVRKALDEVKLFLEKLKVNRILIYPYAHLSSNLAQPNTALLLLKEMEKHSKEKGIEAYRAPFGWCKQFTISIKGHPLAEQSKVFQRAEEAAERKESKKTAEIKREYLIFTEDGRTYPPEDYKFKDSEREFKLLVEKEALGIESKGGEEPDYIRHMKKFGFDWEPMSDLGHMRFGPMATLIFDLVSDYSQQIASSIGLPVYFVKGTNMFSLDLDPIKEHAELFGSRMYKIDIEDKSYVMRYAACFQQFAMMKNWQISYRHLPFGAFEIADSYRLEQSGELLLSFRTRRMNMPDLHVLCKDVDEAEKWFFELHKRIYSEMRDSGRDYYSLYNLTSKEFFEQNKKWFMELMRLEKKPVLLCFYPEGVDYYWILNIEYHIIDKMDRPREIGTVQIDVGNAKRFGIKYTDEKGSERYPVILHSAVIGTIERYLYTIFDTALTMETPTLKVWLSPTQVRLIPISEKYIEKCQEIAEKIGEAKIRVDIDDRRESVNKRIREAEQEWIPYIICIGEREAESKILPIRVRGIKNIENMELAKLIKEVNEKAKDKPFRKLPLPTTLSQRPIFAG